MVATICANVSNIDFIMRGLPGQPESKSKAYLLNIYMYFSPNVGVGRVGRGPCAGKSPKSGRVAQHRSENAF